MSQRLPLLSVVIMSLILLTCTTSDAQQPWMKAPYYNNTHPDSTSPVYLKDVQAAFAAWEHDHATVEAEDENPPKGDEEEEQRPGWLQFKRWENHMAPRVYPTGDISLPAKKYQIYNDYVSNFRRALGPAPSGTVTGSWVAKGPGSVPSGGGAGRINFIRFNPSNSNTIWIGSPSGGLWKSTTGGTSWSTNTDALSLIGCSDVVINPQDTSAMYLATGDGDASDNHSIGVLKSNDGGVTWNTTGLVWPVSNYYVIRKMVMNPSDTTMIILASNNGIYRTTNSGSTWTQVQSGNFYDVAFKPGSPSTVYAVSTKFYVSTNTGASFTSTATGLPTSNVERMEIGVSAANSSYVYVLADNSTYSAFLGLYLSTNSGTSFTTQSTTPNLLGYNTNGSDTTAGQGWYTLSIAVNPSNASDVYVGGVNHWRSTNSGSTWTCITQWYGCCGYPYVHADVHNISFLPGSSTTLYSCNDGGIFKSTNNGTAWTDISNNLQIAQMYRLGTSATDSNLTITGHQDNGTNLMNSSTWSYVIGGDGMEAAIGHSHSNLMFGEIYYGEIYKSTNTGSSFNGITNSNGTGVNAQGAWVTPYVMHPTNDSTLLVGKYQVFRTTNAGSTWSQLGTFITDSPNVIIALAYAPSNANYIYAATSNKIAVSTNGGSTWTNITGTLPVGSASITYIAVSASNPAKVWVTFSGYSSGNKVYVSSNTGSTWTNYSTGLPNLPVNCIAYQNNTNDGLYVGTDVGVYFISNSLASWQAFNTGLPDVEVDELEIQYQMDKMRAATYGRGLWQTGLAIPVAAFSASNTTVCTGTTVTFTDQSVGTATGWNWTFTGASTTTSTSQNPSVTYNTAGTYPVTLVASNAEGTDTTTKTSYITVVAASVGGTASATSSTICSGSTASLSLTSYTGSIQWQSSTNNVTFTNISGATSATYTSGALSATTYYRAVVTNGSCTSANSTTVTITVNAHSVGGTATATAGSLCSGSSTSINLSGNTGSIQWQSSTDNVTFSNISGATSSSYTTPSLTATTYYRAVVTSGVCSSANSTTSTVTVYPHSVGGSAPATSRTLCSGSSTSLTLSGSTGSIQWQSSTDNLTFGNISGATSATYTTPALTSTTYYRAVVTSGVCSSANSTTDTVTISPLSVAGTATAVTGILCSGNSTSLSLTGYTGSIQWQSSSNNVTFSNISGATSATYLTPSLTSNIYYRAVVTSGVCSSATSNTDSITVNPLSVGGTISPGSSALCSGSSTTLSLTGNTGTLQWQSSSDNLVFTNISGATSGSYTTPALTTTTYYRVVVTSGVCTAANSTKDTITVSAHSAGGTATATTDTLCSGSTTAISLTGYTGTIQWQSSIDNVTFSNISGATSSSYTTPSLTATTYYRVVVTSGVCASANSTTSTVTVYPHSVGGSASAASRTLCSGSSTSLALTGATGTIQWQSSNDNLTFGNISGATSATYTTPALTTTTYYRAVVTSGVCASANSTTDTVTISPLSVAGTVHVVADSLCSGSSTTASLTGYTGSIQWQSSTNDVTFSNISGATSASYTTAALTSTTYYRTVVTSGVCAAANSGTDSVVVSPHSLAGTAVATNGILCSGSSTILTLTGSTGGVQWQSSSDNITFANIAGATSATYNTPVLTSTTYYRAVVTSGVCASANSNKDTITISPQSAGGIATALADTLCSGSSTSLSLAGYTGTIQWQSSTDNLTFTDLTGATSASYTTGALSINTYYRAVVTSGVCAPANSTTDGVIINPLSAGGTATAATTTLCSGNSTTLSLAGSAGSVQWQSSPDNLTFTNINGATSTTYNTPVLTSTTYFRAVVTGGVCASVNSNIDTIIVSPVSIPGSATLSNGTLCSGNSTSVSLTGSTGAIQWQSSADNITFANIGGATSTTYNTPALTSTIYYRAVVTSGVCASATSTVDTVIVSPLSVGGNITPGSSALCSGSSTVLSLTGYTGTLQWQSSADNLTFTNISGATSASYNTPALTSTIYYRVVAISGVCSLANSTKDTITVSPLSVAGSSTVSNGMLCSGNSTSVSLTGSTGAIQWQSSADNITFVNITGANSATYNTPALTTTIYYRAVVTSGVCASATSTVDTVIVSPLSVGGSITPGSSALCSGSSTTLSLTGYTGTLQWQSSADNITFANISGATSASYNTPALTSTIYYRAIATSGVCSLANSTTDTITVSPVSVAGSAVAANGTLCSGNSTSVSLTGSTGAIQWQSSSDNITFANISGATSATYNTPALTTTIYYRAVVTSGVCASATSTVDTVIVSPLSVGGNITPGSSALCSGSSTVLSLTGYTGTLQWQSSADNLTFTDISGATSASYNTPALTSTIYYQVIATSGVCAPANSTTDTITVSPLSVAGSVSSADDTLCAGSTTSVAVTGSTGNIQWQSSTDNLVFADISGATSGTYSTPALNATMWYRAVVTSGVCTSANSATTVVIVHPLTAITQQPFDQSTCVGGSVTFSVSANGANLNYQWFKGADTIPGAILSDYSIATAAFADSGAYSVIVSGACGTHTSDTAQFTLTQSVSVSLQPVSQSVCLGSPVTFSVVANGINTHYQWIKNAHNITGANSPTYTLNAVGIADSGTYSCAITSNCGDTTSLTAQLTVLQPASYTYSYNICNGSIYNFNGRNLTLAGTYKDTLQAANTCDSIITLNLQLQPVYNNNISAAICPGSSYTFAGQTLTTAGQYSDTLASVSGCDSIINLTLTQNTVTYSSVSDSFCQGSSYTFNGRVITQSGTYIDTLNNAHSCDSIITLTLATKIPPVVTLNLIPDTACKNGAIVTLAGGSPAGGVYTGTGVTGGSFDPSSVSTGQHVIVYTVTANNGCSGSDSSNINVEACLGINETSIDRLITVFPNPASNVLIAESYLFSSDKPKVLVYDLTGKLLEPAMEYRDHQVIIHLDGLADGTYWLSLKTGGKTATKLFVKIK